MQRERKETTELKKIYGKRDDRKGTTTDLNKTSKSETLDGEEVQISEHKEEPKEVKEVAPEVKKEQPKEEVNPVEYNTRKLLKLSVQRNKEQLLKMFNLIAN